MQTFSMADTYGRGVKDRQAQEANQLAIDAGKYQFDQNQQLDNTKWLAAMGQYGLSLDPAEYATYMPKIEEEGRRRGLWERIGDGKFDYNNAAPEEIRKGFQRFYDEGMAGLKGFAGPGMEDVSQEEAPYAQRNPVTNEVGRVGASGRVGKTWVNPETRTMWGMMPDGTPFDTGVPAQQYATKPIETAGGTGTFDPGNPMGNPGVIPGTEASAMRDRAAADEEAKKTANLRATRTMDIPSAYAMRSQSTQNLTRLEDAVKALADNENLWKATGLYGAISYIPGTEGADIRADIQNLKSQIGFMVLQDMRNASKTGGALGQVSEKENELLQDNLAALRTSQSPEAFQGSLQTILDYINQAKGRIDHAWKLTYPELDEYANKVGGQPYRPGTGQTIPMAPTGVIPTGKTAINPTTNERLQEMSDGSWQPIQ